jgi:hypothetical protein
MATQEAIDNVYVASLELCKRIYKSPYLAARDAMTLTNNIVNIHDIDIALGNIHLDAKDFRDKYGNPRVDIDFGGDVNEWQYDVAAIVWLAAAREYLADEA